MSIRDIKSDYKRALIEEHANFVRAGQADRAASVAAILNKHYGYEVPRPEGEESKKESPRRGRPPKERADEPKAPESAVEPKPEHSGHGKG